MVVIFGGDHSFVPVGENDWKEGSHLNITVKELHKTYGKDVIFQDLSFSLENISSLGIIGASGCGKSTLLRQLAGIENPDSGEILVDGCSPILDKKAFQEKIGVVFQRHYLFPHLSILKNITLILEKIKKMSKEEAEVKAEQLLAQLFMEKQKDKRPDQVSGGQAQRASIARALATDPELIFLDEPTAALDPQLSYEVLQAVAQLKSTGIHFIFVTHEMKFLRDFADYFLFLQGGEIAEQGAISQLDHPKTEDLRKFLSLGEG